MENTEMAGHSWWFFDITGADQVTLPSSSTQVLEMS
jgi:hypothetical protein